MVMNEKTKEFINVSLTEYRELRSELRDIISRQFLIISLTITAISTLFGFYVEKTNNIVNSEIIFALLIPCLSTFSGILWMDCIYRQVKIGTYISVVENKINELFSENEHKALNWEHYADSEAKETFIKKINHFQYYFGLAFYLLMPMISFLYLLSIIKKWDFTLLCFLILSILMYIFFIIFIRLYLKSISKKIVEINGNELIKPTSNDN